MNELCLRQGGSLPIFESGYLSNDEGELKKKVTTMISLAIDKLNQHSEDYDNASLVMSESSWENYDCNDVMMANSTQVIDSVAFTQRWSM